MFQVLGLLDLYFATASDLSNSFISCHIAVLCTSELLRFIK